MSNTDDVPHIEGSGSEKNQKSRAERARSLMKTWWPHTAALIAALGYAFVPFVQDGMEWIWLLVWVAAAWLWTNGYALPVLVGVLFMWQDSVFGVRARTTAINLRFWKEEKKRPNWGKAVVYGQPSLNYFVVSAAFGVVYLAGKLFSQPAAAEADYTLWAAVLDGQVYIDTVEVMAGVLLGLIIGPKLASVAKRLLVIGTLNDYFHFEEKWVIGSVIRGVASVAERVRAWGNLNDELTVEEIAENERAMLLDRAVAAPIAVVLNIVNGIRKLLFATRWYVTIPVWLSLGVVTLWMVELSASLLVSTINSAVYIPAIIVAFAIAVMVSLAVRALVNLKAPTWFGNGLGVSTCALLLMSSIQAASWFDYHTHMYYGQYKHMEIVDLRRGALPTSAAQRLYAQAAIAAGAVSRTEFGKTAVSNPALVRNGDELFWTAQRESLHWTERMFNPTSEVYNLPATKTNVTFDAEDGQLMQDVCFDASEKGRFGRNVMTSAHRRLPTRLLANHVPHQKKEMIDDNGRMVQVVSIARYAGVPLRRQAFGGVVVIPQCEYVEQHWLQGSLIGKIIPQSIASMIDQMIPSGVYRELFGLGKYISPAEIAAGKYPFLKGNNLISEQTARRMAEALRYHEDPWAPISFGRTGDVRIADQDTDTNSMPHMGVWQDLPGNDRVSARPEPAIYGSLILQPAGRNEKDQQSSSNTLRYLVLVPADGATTEDGRPIVYVLDAKKESMDSYLGVTEMAAQVRESVRKGGEVTEYELVDRMPLMRHLDGKVRLLYSGRMVPERSEGAIVFKADPRVAILDPKTTAVHQLERPGASDAGRDAEILASFGERWGVTAE